MQGVSSLLGNKVDVLTIAETKIGESFPSTQFTLEGYSKPYRLDVTSSSGGLFVYINEYISSYLKHDFQIGKILQIVSIEINLRKKKWIIISIYGPPKQHLNYFLSNLSLVLDFHTRKYDNVLLMGDFNAEPHSLIMKLFMENHDLYNHVKTKTCWKSPSGTCIDLLLSNRKFPLKHTGVVETGLSDHHSLIYTMLKLTYKKLRPRKFYNRDYKNYDKEIFLQELKLHLYSSSDISYNVFQDIFHLLLDKHSLLKARFLRANNKPHLTKNLGKAIMIRSRLKDIANKSKSPRAMANYRYREI